MCMLLLATALPPFDAVLLLVAQGVPVTIGYKTPATTTFAKHIASSFRTFCNAKIAMLQVVR